MKYAAQFAQDVGYGARSMRRSAASTLIAALVLALGVGANAAVFSVVNKVLLEPLPYPAADRLVQVFCASPMGPMLATSVPKFAAWRRQQGTFEHLAAFSPVEPTSIAIGGEQEVRAAVRVSADYFPVFGIDVSTGRVPAAAEDVPGGPNQAVISQRLWRRYFAGAALSDRTLVIDDRAYAVIGVVAADAPVDGGIDVWLPLRAEASSTNHSSWLQVVGRLRRGLPPSEAARQLRYSTDPFKKAFPDAMGPLESFTAEPLRDVLVADARPTLMVLLGAVAFVLLIACANVANLLLIQGNQRRSEISLRIALGASRQRIIVQLLTESTLLSLLGGAAGLATGYAGVRWLLAVNRDALPLIASGGSISLDWRVLIFTLTVVLVTTIVSGLYPALHGSRVDIRTMLRAAGGTQAGLAHSRVRSALVVVQMACTVVLLIGAGLMLRTLLEGRVVDPGFDARGVLTLETVTSGPELPRTADLAQFVRRAETRIEALAGVEAAAITSALPLEPTVSVPFVIDRRPLMGSPYHGMARIHRVSHRYFDVLRIRLIAGRRFTQHDAHGGQHVALVNTAFARKYWPGGSPLQERITISQFARRELADAPRIVVGIVDDIRDGGSQRRPEPAMYVPVGQVGDAMNAFLNQTSPLRWAVRTAVQPVQLSAAIQRELRASSRELLIGRIRGMEEIVARSAARSEFIATLLTIFAAIALVLAAIGLYGVLAYSVQQRTREFGVRMAIGAAPAAIRRMVLGEGVWLMVIGLALGTAAAVVLRRYAVSLVHGVATWDPVVFAGAVLLLSALAVLSTLVSAWRATNVQPTEALRHV